VFAAAREKARQNTCVSNEKQILTGMIQYCQDNDEYYPSAVINMAFGAKTNDGWEEEIWPYMPTVSTAYSGGMFRVEGPGVFMCPDDNVLATYSAPQSARTTYAMPDDDIFGHYLYTGYTSSTWAGGMSGHCITSDGHCTGGQEAYQVSDVGAPDATLMLVEFANGYNVYMDPTPGYSVSSGPAYSIAASVGASNSYFQQQDVTSGPNVATSVIGSPLHSGGWNYGFVDGHVKWLRPEQTIGTKFKPQNQGNRLVLGGMWSVNPND